MPDQRLSVSTKQYLYSEVSATDGTDPSSDSCWMGFSASEKTAPTTWTGCSWTTTTDAQGKKHYKITCLIGTGGAVLSVGVYVAWDKWSDSGEIIVTPSGTLEIY